MSSPLMSADETRRQRRFILPGFRGRIFALAGQSALQANKLVAVCGDKRTIQPGAVTEKEK